MASATAVALGPERPREPAHDGAARGRRFIRNFTRSDRQDARQVQAPDVGLRAAAHDRIEGVAGVLAQAKVWILAAHLAGISGEVIARASGRPTRRG